MQLKERANQALFSQDYSRNVSIYSIIMFFANWRQIFNWVKDFMDRFLMLPDENSLNQYIDELKNEQSNENNDLINWNDRYEVITQLEKASDQLQNIKQLYRNVYNVRLDYGLFWDYIKDKIASKWYDYSVLNAIDVWDVLIHINEIYQSIMAFTWSYSEWKYILSTDITYNWKELYPSATYNSSLNLLSSLWEIYMQNDYREFNDDNQYLV